MTTPTNLKEIKMNTLTPFSGEQKKLDNFLLKVEMYQMMNDRVYNTDRKKIIFALSFMKDGVAKMWKQHTAENATFGIWEEFKDTLKRSYTPANKEGNMITKMQIASMTEKTTDEFIEEFKNWQLQSGVNKDRPLIEWFLTALPTSLRDKILQKENPPTTLKWKAGIPPPRTSTTNGESLKLSLLISEETHVRATPKPASSMTHSTVTRALALWAHT